MKEPSVDKDKVLALSRRYGQLDGEVSYHYAKAFAEVARTLTADQKKALLKLRNLDARYTCKGAYLYSAPIDMPQIPNTDFLFAASAASRPAVTAGRTVSGPARSLFVLRSPEVADGGQLPREYTGDGAAATLPLEWSGAPVETKSFAIIMHHVAPDQVKWYWVLYDIPASAHGLPKNVQGVGTLGNNSINDQIGYAPPHSKGPGPKTYIYTVYALSSPVKLNVKPAEVSRDVLLAAMKGKILDTAELHVVYTRDVPGNAPLDASD
jgi:phosphatidylethanolamine-binding protein (PEBP) family uncharacterized protein